MTIDVDKCIIASVVLMSIFILYLAGVLSKVAIIFVVFSGLTSLVLCFGLFAYFMYDYFFKKEIFRKDEK